MTRRGQKKPALTADRRQRGTKKGKPASRRGKGRDGRKGVRRRNPFSRLLRWIVGSILRLTWAIGWRFAAVMILITGAAVAYSYTTLPNFQDLLDGRARGSVTLLDQNGDVFAWRGDQFGGVVTSETVSPHLKNAVIAIEDKRFFGHPGVDPVGIASAIRINLREGRGPFSGHGGSTITQQTAKLLCFGTAYDKERWDTEKEYLADCRRTSMWRKVREAIYAMAMELKYSKNEILSVYLNRAYMGGGAYGAEAASQRFFGKSAAQLNVSESAMLAGLLTAPSTLAPTSNLERSRNRASVVIALMQDQERISDTDAATALANPAELSEAAQAQAGGYFADWVMVSGPEYFTRDTTEDVIIRTTLDQRIQKAAEEALQHVFETKVKDGSNAQAAIVVMSADGAVRAMVGGRQAKVSGAFNRATQARRQTGSSFKPFVYGTALELGYTHDSTVVDEPYCIDIPGSGEWCPENYTRKHYGRVTLAQALANSLNVPAVKISESVGRDLVRRVASDFGIDSSLSDGPALALGASESTLIEMTGAYAGILNGGSSVTPYGLVELSLLGEEEPLMGLAGGIGERVIREQAARELTYMMSGVVSAGTGERAKLPDREVAGKTGTTQAMRDAWFLGFTADYVAGVWMGNDDNTPLTGVTGGGLPAEIWRETMIRVHEDMPARQLPMLRPAPKPQSSGNRNTDRGSGGGIEGILRNLLGGTR